MKIGTIGAAGAGKTMHYLRVYDTPYDKSTPTIFLNVFPPWAIRDVLSDTDSIIKINGKPMYVEVFDVAGDPLKMENSFDAIKKYIKTFDVLIHTIDGTKIDESINELNNFWRPLVKKNQLSSVIVTKLGVSEQLNEQEISAGVYESLDKCLKFSKSIKSVYTSVVESIITPREIAVLSNYEALDSPCKLKHIGGAITIPIIDLLIEKEHGNWLEKVIRRNYVKSSLVS